MNNDEDPLKWYVFKEARAFKERLNAVMLKLYNAVELKFRLCLRTLQPYSHV